MKTQYNFLGSRIDLYFYDCLLAIEVNELGHTDTNVDHKIQRQKAIE